jgi:hypothetical protein
VEVVIGANVDTVNTIARVALVLGASGLTVAVIAIIRSLK